MRRQVVLAFAFCLVSYSTVALAAAQSPQSPKPSPETQKLGYFVGTWQDESETKASPFGPAGIITGTSSCEWQPGGFQVMCRSEVTGPEGKVTGFGVLAWHPGRKAYVGMMGNSAGLTAQMTGTLAGNIWTWTDEGATPDGKPVKFRVTIVEESPTVQTGKVEVAMGGETWTLIEQMKSTKKK